MSSREPSSAELCKQYADVAVTIAFSIWASDTSLQSRLPRSEVESAANYALYQAAVSWDPDVSSFRSWLNRKVRYELQETARREAPVRRAGIVKARMLSDAEKVAGENASDVELAVAAGCKVTDIREARRLRELAREPAELPASPGHTESSLDESVTNRVAVLDAIAGLDVSGQAVLLLHYFDDIPFSEIARSLGMRKDQVSRIHTRAKLQLRLQLQAA